MNQQTTWMYPDNIYVTSGGACSNSLLFEDKHCHLPAGRTTSILQAGELFFLYMEKFVGPMVDILHYKLHATEWAFLIHTKSEEEIRAAYIKQRKKSKKADRQKDYTAVHRMLSEHFRMALSSFAAACNKYLKRKGVLVMRRFDKYPIPNAQNYYQEFERICDLKFCKYQQILEKYQPDIRMYDEDKLLGDEDGNPHALRSSVGLYSGKVKIEKLPISLRLVRPFSDVLRKLLNEAKKDNKPKKPPPKRE